MEFDREAEAEVARMFKALGHPTRIWIVRQLLTERHCVREFVKALGVEFATVSRHLSKLKQTGLIASRKQGREIWYELNQTAIRRLVDALG